EYSRNATITNLDSAEPTVTYGDWTLTSNNEIAVSSPVETGYMADTSSVAAGNDPSSVAADGTLPSDSTV
ncbi:mucin-binding protein, partial [Paucilactobacillus suebicus]